MKISDALTTVAARERRIGKTILHGTNGAEAATRRDNSIIAMDAHGCTAREIALELGLHPTTVERVLKGVVR